VPDAEKTGQGHWGGGHLFPRVSGAGCWVPRWRMLHTEGQNRSVQVARFGSGLAVLPGVGSEVRSEAMHWHA
jgi:hypothetical protein